MKRRRYLAPAALTVFSVLVILVGGMWLRQMALGRINQERKQQLEELTVQLSDMFGNALEASRACVGTAANLFAEGEYDSEADIAQAAARLAEIVLTGEEEKETQEEDIFFFLDENGVCYDEDGAGSIWGDFDQVIGSDDYFIFIADSVNYKGVYWAFVRRLETPVTTEDGDVTICYVVLLKTVGSMSRYYKSEAYNDVCETYILKENGTRMYDSVTAEDTISSYNIYKNLRESRSSYGTSFDEVLEELEKNGVACGNYESGGTEYCYSLAWKSEYQFVLLFLIPTGAVAVNTVAMISTMMGVFIAAGVVMLSLLLLFAFTLLRLANSRKLAQLREKNLEETRQANAKLEQANESLLNANRVAKSALDIARSANRAKSSFLSNMSHDIRTPLNAIIGFLTLLEQDVSDPQRVRTYLGKIRVSSQHLLNLINDILDMSRIESGKTTLNAEEFSIGRLLEETQAVVESQVQEKHLNFSIEAVDVGELTVRGDRLRLGQILMNLLSNAVKYTPEGGTILLKAECCGNPSPQMETLRFSVKDNGVGMSEEFQKRLFEPFEREQTSLTSTVQGTGLGMAITKNLVDLMGGIIFVDSVPGEGSTFTLELPFPLAEKKTERKEGKEETGQEETGQEETGQEETGKEETGEEENRKKEAGKEEIRKEGIRKEENRKKEAGKEEIRKEGIRKEEGGTENRREEKRKGETKQESGGAPEAENGWDFASGKGREPEQRQESGKEPEPKQQTAIRAEQQKRAEIQNADVLNGLHFLVAEDNEINAEIIEELLALEGATCEIAVNGKEALELFEKSRPGAYDAIFMDIQMPVMGGYEAARQIRACAHADAARIPIAAMTANAFSEDVQKALQAGMNTHIPKPIDMRKVRDFIAGEKGERKG